MKALRGQDGASAVCGEQKPMRKLSAAENGRAAAPARRRKISDRVARARDQRAATVFKAPSSPAYPFTRSWSAWAWCFLRKKSPLRPSRRPLGRFSVLLRDSTSRMRGRRWCGAVELSRNCIYAIRCKNSHLSDSYWYRLSQVDQARHLLVNPMP